MILALGAVGFLAALGILAHLGRAERDAARLGPPVEAVWTRRVLVWSPAGWRDTGHWRGTVWGHGGACGHDANDHFGWPRHRLTGHGGDAETLWFEFAGAETRWRVEYTRGPTHRPLAGQPVPLRDLPHSQPRRR